MSLRKTCLGTAFAIAMGSAFAIPAPAAEIKAGTVVHAGNLDQLLEQTFDGTPLGALIPERFQWQIREKGLTMKLAHAKPHPIDPVLKKAGEKNRTTVSLDPETRRVVDWKAGAPFPDIKLDDPDAGMKVIWNLFYGRPRGDSQVFPNTSIAMINGEKGIEGVTHQELTRVFLKGLLRRPGKPTLGSGKLFDKNILVMTAPDIFKGNGLLFYRYDTGGTDYLLIYAKDANKVVKWSGDFWMDQIGETDFLGDDLLIFSAYPTWYDGYKILAKKKILVIANTAHPFFNNDAVEDADLFPGFETQTKPHWNPVDVWEPREVYVIEATAPALHPYSRKILYIDPENWVPYLGEFYTKKGELWKTTIQGYHVFPIEKEPKGSILWPTWALIVDFKRNHGTIFATDDSVRFNEVIDPALISLNTLKGGREDTEIDVPWSELKAE